MDQRGSAAMLAITRSADVTSEVNLRNPLQISGEVHKQVIHHGLETQGRHRQKFKSGVLVDPQKGLVSSKNVKTEWFSVESVLSA